MIRTPPALNALRTFEAAARHRSFSRAAEALNVTPAAVSYAVRELEAQLGTRLFERTSRTMRLTERGEILLVAVAGAFETINHAVERIARADDMERINVSATSSFAIKWLVPRLNRFLSLHPDVDVRIDMSRQVVDLERGEIDLAIRFGTGQYPGLAVERLLTDTLFPVCSPILTKGPRPVRQPSDLRRHTLIHVDWQSQGDVWPTWEMWLSAAGVEGIDPRRGIHFKEGVLALQAAIDGQGVALGDSSLASTDLAAGRLVRPFALELPAPERLAYWIVMAPRSTTKPLLVAFRDWLIREASTPRPKPKAGKGRSRAAQ